MARIGTLLRLILAVQVALLLVYVGFGAAARTLRRRLPKKPLPKDIETLTKLSKLRSDMTIEIQGFGVGKACIWLNK